MAKADPDQYRAKVEWHRALHRHNIITLSISLSGRIVEEFEDDSCLSSDERRHARVEFIARTAGMVYQDIAGKMIAAAGSGYFDAIRTPHHMLEAEIAAQRDRIRELEASLAERTAQRDELRRIFEQRPRIVQTGTPFDLEREFGPRLTADPPAS